MIGWNGATSGAGTTQLVGLSGGAVPGSSPAIIGLNGATSGAGAAHPIRVGIMEAKDLPIPAQQVLQKYIANGWKGNVSGQPSGTKAAGIYKDTDGDLPKFDSSGNKITYREFDVNNKIPGVKRDAERFLYGSDGTIYYTNEHYDSFYIIKR